ncbi:alkaline-shock protein [Candidatus Epulonipiscioides gigas]|nr:alkaline-shock protein [Epulopiscium sp. SCG-C07WGA-EpuloA2]
MQKFTNKCGDIEINEQVITGICGICVGECYGIVGMASRSLKDGIVRLLLRDNITKGIAVSIEGDHINIEFHIIIEYGTKISAVTDNLMNTIRYKLKEMLDVKVGLIKIFVEGVRLDT